MRTARRSGTITTCSAQHATMRLLMMIALAGTATVAAAQKPVPVEEPAQQQETAIQRGQYRAGQAYRELQQAQYETKLAEQDVLNAEEAYRRTQQQNDELKRQLEAASKALAAAKAREAAARQAYDKEVDAVDRLQRNLPTR